MTNLKIEKNRYCSQDTDAFWPLSVKMSNIKFRKIERKRSWIHVPFPDPGFGAVPKRYSSFLLDVYVNVKHQFVQRIVAESLMH